MNVPKYVPLLCDDTIFLGMLDFPSSGAPREYGDAFSFAEDDEEDEDEMVVVVEVVVVVAGLHELW